MPYRFGRLALAAALASITALSPLAAQTLEQTDRLRWYRGNMHTHSHWSDGNDYLETIGLWYRDHGYNFLVFTDHNVLPNTERWVEVANTKGGEEAYTKLKAAFPDWVEQRHRDGQLEVRLRRFDEVADKLDRPGEFLLIQGEEISDRFERLPIHLNASNIEKVIPPRGGTSVRETIQNNVDAVVAERKRSGRPMIIHLNHPNFGYAVTAEDLMHILGERFFEVYNGHPAVHNSGDEDHPSTERMWDIVLSKRLAELDLPVMYGIAVDDGHEYHDISPRKSNPGRGWVTVLADKLTPAALIESLEAGRFYASSGVTLQRIDSTDQTLSVEVDPQPDTEYTIEFIGTRAGTPLTGEPVLDEEGNPVRTTQRYSPKIGEVLKTVHGVRGEYRFAGDEIYVRARVTSSTVQENPAEAGDRERAWVQPVIGPAAR